jgi:hypothetical protein
VNTVMNLRVLAPRSYLDSCRVVNTPVSYSGGPGLKYLPLRLAILIQLFRGFP